MSLFSSVYLIICYFMFACVCVCHMGSGSQEKAREAIASTGAGDSGSCDQSEVWDPRATHALNCGALISPAQLFVSV